MLSVFLIFAFLVGCSGLLKIEFVLLLHFLSTNTLVLFCWSFFPGTFMSVFCFVRWVFFPLQEDCPSLDFSSCCAISFSLALAWAALSTCWFWSNGAWLASWPSFHSREDGLIFSFGCVIFFKSTLLRYNTHTIKLILFQAHSSMNFGKELPPQSRCFQLLTRMLVSNIFETFLSGLFSASHQVLSCPLLCSLSSVLTLSPSQPLICFLSPQFCLFENVT